MDSIIIYKNKIVKTVLLLIFTIILNDYFLSDIIVIKNNLPIIPPPLENQNDKKDQLKTLKRKKKIGNSIDIRANIPFHNVEGLRKILVVMIEFKDRTFPSKYDKEYFRKLLFSKNKNDYSLNNYYKENSYGKLSLDGKIIDDIKINESILGYKYYPGHENKQIGILIKKIIEKIKNKVDLKEYDIYGNKGGCKKDKILDHLMIIFPTENLPWIYNQDIWSHRGAINPKYLTIKSGDIKIQNYVIVGHSFKLGTFCHEFAHDLGLPDLFDDDYSSYGGVGNWDIMSYGVFLSNSYGEIPPHLSAWCKIKLGWIKPSLVTNTYNSVTIPNIEENAFCLKIPIGDFRSKEYFLVTNRQRIGFDQGIQDTGLLIWHVDENQKNNNDDNYRLINLMRANETSINNIDNSNLKNGDFPYVKTESAFGNCFDVNDKFNDNTIPNTNSNFNLKTEISIDNIRKEDNKYVISLKMPELIIPTSELITLSNENYKDGFVSYINIDKNTEILQKYKLPDNDLYLTEIEALIINMNKKSDCIIAGFNIYNDDNDSPGEIIYSDLNKDVTENVWPPVYWKNLYIQHKNFIKLEKNKTIWFGITIESSSPELKATVAAINKKKSSKSFLRNIETEVIQELPKLDFIMRLKGYEDLPIDFFPYPIRNYNFMKSVNKNLREALSLDKIASYDKALTLYNNCLKKLYYKKEQYVDLLFDLFYQMGLNRLYARNYEDSIKYLKFKERRIIRNNKLHDMRKIYNLYYSIAIASYYSENKIDAIEYFQKSLKENQNIDKFEPRNDEYFDLYYWLGKIDFENKKYKEALIYFDKAILYAKKILNIYGIKRNKKLYDIMKKIEIIENILYNNKKTDG